MHKSVSNLVKACEKVPVFFTGKILQHFLCGVIAAFCATFTSRVQSFYTAAFQNFYLLFLTFTRYQQPLLKELLSK